MTKKKSSKHSAICKILRNVGQDVRSRINKLPTNERTLAWASIAAMVTAAGIHDCEDHDKIIDMVYAAIQGMGPHMAERRLTNAYSTTGHV